MAIRFKYNGAGFLPDLPARDLTDEDVAALTDAQRATLEAHMALGTGKAPDGPPDESKDDKAARLAAFKDESERLAAARIYEAVGGTHAPAAAPDHE